MAKYSNTVEYNIKTNLDASGIAKLNTQLRQVEAELQRLQGRGVLNDAQVKKDLANINQIKTALNAAFNPNLGMLDTKKFMAGLTAGGKTLQSYANTFNTLGTKGTQAFASWYGQLGKIDTGMRQISKTGDKIMNTLGNTVRWGLIASAFSSVMNAAHQSVQYVQDLDRSLTNIMMVSGETKANMNEFARAANEVAQRLGGTTTQMTEATKVFVQQGMSLGQSSQMAEYAVHLANISEQDSSTTSDELTAMKNAFKLEIGDMGNAVSKWAAIANNAAVSMEELSVASQKAASVANTVGVSMEQFAGHIAAIEATTREAPENIGNGLKTLYSRIADIKLGDTLEDGVNYGQFSGALKKVGVDVLDVTGEMKDAGTIMEEIMAVWQDLSRTQQNALATTVAGRFQLARFEALMNSQDIYKKSVGVAREETGTETYDRMQDTYRESLEGRSKALTAAIEEIFLKAFDTDSFYGLIDTATQLTKVFGDLVEAVGGGGAAITAFGAILTKVMSNNISRGMANFAANRQRDAMVKSNINEARTNAQLQIRGQGVSLNDKDAMQVVNQTAQGAQFAHLMNQEQLDKFNKSLSERTQLLGALKAAEQEETQALERFGQAFQELGVGEEAAEVGLMAFLEMLKEGGAEITTAQLQTKGLKQALSSLQSAQGQMSGFAGAINEVAIAESKFGVGTDEYKAALANMKNSAQSLRGVLTQLAESETLTENATKKLASVIKLLDKAEKEEFESTEKLALAFKQGQIDVNFFSEALAKLLQEGLLTDEQFEKMSGDLALLRERFDSASMGASNLNAQMANQNRMNGIVEAVSAVGQLAFAWQSFKSLGSLFADDSIDMGKKLEEVILNLAMTLPMLLFGFNQLQTALGLPGIKAGIANITQMKAALTEAKAATQAASAATVAQEAALKEVTAASKTSAAAASASVFIEKDLAAARAVETAATKAETVATNELKAARMGLALNIGLIAATAVIMAATTAWGAYQQSIENAKQAELDHLNETTAATQELQRSLSTWEELYKDFQETGTASEQAKEKAKELADELEIAGGKALAASGNFEALNTSIQKLADTKLKENITAAKDLLEGEYGKSLKGEELFNGSAQLDYATALSRGIGTQADEYGNVIYESSVANLLKRHQLGSDASVAETIGEARSAIADLEQYLEDLEKQESSMNPQVFKQYKEEAQNAKQALREFLSLDDIKAAEQAYKSLFENGTQLSDFQSRLEAAGTSLKEMRDVFATDSNTREYFNNMATEAERLQMMFAATKDEAQKLKIEVAQTGSEAATNMMQMQMKDGASQEGARATTQGIFDRISNMGLYDEEAIELLAMIKEEDSIEAINEGIKRIEESGNIEDFKIPAEPLTDEELRDQTWESTKNYSKDNMEESVDLETATAFGEYLAQNAESLEGYDGALEKNADLLKEVVEEQGRYDAALQETQKSYDDWSDALENGSLVEQAKAGAELSEVYEDLLDIGDDLSLSDTFVQDTENLESLKEAAEGTEEAYDDLQDAAAEDIMIQAGLDDSEVQEKMETLDSLQDRISDLKIGATIDDEAAYQEMEDLINGLGLDAQAASEYLKMVAGIEIDPSAFEEVLPSVVDAAAEAGNQTADNLTFDTEIQSGTAQETSTDTYYDVKAQLTPVPFEATLPAGKEGGSTTLTGSVPEVTYTATPVPINKESSTAGFSVNTKSKGGGGGGGAGLTIKRGSASKGSSGGAKYAASPYGGGTKHPSGGGGGCFIAGTPIVLCGYYKNIEDIQIGDIVLSYNEKLMRNEYSEVLETMIHLVNEKIYHLYIENEELVVTGIHRFLIIHYGKKEWVPASELQTGDLVLFANGTWHRIHNIQTEIKNTLVYNFEVSNNHNYYVGHNQILAHNKGGGGKKGKGGGGDKKKDTNLAKSAEVENDIYQEINSTLKSLNQQYSKLEKTTSRIYGPAKRKNIEEQLKLLEKEKLATKDRVKIAQAYLKALETGKSNSKYGISMKNKPSLKSTGLKDYDGDGSIDNYIEKFEQARKVAQAADDAANKYYRDHGGEINKKTGVATKEAQMTEKQQKEYEKLTKAAEKKWKIAENINTVSKEYEETMAQIKDDEEAMIEYQQQMEDLMIDLYHDALDAADAIKDIKDTSAELKGFFSSFSSDSPFRALIEDAQRFQDIMSATDKEFDNYIDNAVKVLEKELKAVESQGDKDKIAAYKNSIKWYKDKKAEYNTNDIGKGELGMATLQLEEMSRWMEQVKNGKLDGLPADSPYRTNTKQLFEDYENQYNKVAKLTLEAEQRLESLQKDQIEALEDTAKRYEKLMDKYDKVAKDLDRTSKRVGIWQGEDAYGAQADISKQLAQTKKQAAQSAKTVLDQYQKARDAAIEKEDAERPARIEKQETEISRIENKLSEAKSEKDKLELEQQLANAKVRLEEIKNDYSEETQWYIDKYEEVYEKIQDLQDEAAEAMKDAYLNAINEIDAQMTQQLFGDRNLENITNDWEWDKDYYGKYKDDVEKTYEIEKLRLKYLDLLDDSQNRSLATQRRIRQAMEEQLNLLENQGTMSEYDVKLANARLEILQKQLALEDARQNKNQMKLRRDTQGNYKYVYSADEGDIRAKQSDLMDEEFNAYEMSKEANRDAMDNVVALWNRYIEQKQAISEKYYNDEDKLAAELDKLEKNFIDAMEANKEDLDDSYNGMILSLEWMVTTGTEDIANMAQDVMDNLDVTNQEAMEKLGYAWSTTIYKVGTELNNLKTQVKKDIDETREAQKELCEFIAGDEGIGAVTEESYGDAQEAIEGAKEATDELTESTKALNTALTQELGAVSAAEEKIAAYQASLENAQSAQSKTAAKLEATRQSLIISNEEKEKYHTELETAKSEAADAKRMQQGKFKKGDTFKLKAGTKVYFGRGGGQQNNEGKTSWKTDKEYMVKVDNTDQHVLDQDGKPTNKTAKYHIGFHVIDKGWKYVLPDTDPPNVGDRIHEQWHLDKDSLADAVRLDTGGYTGDWSDSEGRAAILHKKELVLNETDTENILTAIQFIRETISQLKVSSIKDMFKNIPNSAYNGETIEQRVSITAEFPNANSADEIKQALLNLADSAMQYAYKER